MMNTPVLYSFRRCPYCMRAHMALKYAGIKVELREVDLTAMPEDLLEISAASADEVTVPVLLLENNSVMHESWDIVKWALQINDPDNYSGSNNEFLLDAEILVETNDFSFKTDLDHYKYADRFPEHSMQYYRELCEEFIEELEEKLLVHEFLLAQKMSLADIAVFPFVRQFSLIDKNWFDQAPYPEIQRWLTTIIDSTLFENVFQKHKNWQPGDEIVYL